MPQPYVNYYRKRRAPSQQEVDAAELVRQQQLMQALQQQAVMQQQLQQQQTAQDTVVPEKKVSHPFAAYEIFQGEAIPGWGGKKKSAFDELFK